MKLRKGILRFLVFFFLSYFSGHAEARLYFMHVPKTGGTTLRCLLEQQLAVQEIYPYRNSKSARGPVHGELVSGHFPFWFCQDFDEDFESSFKVTILREPVERYLSFLRAKKKADPELPDLESVIRLRQSSDKYREGLIDNALCRYLSSDPLLEGEDLLESAKQALGRIDCVLFFDRFAQDVIALFKRLGIDIDEDDIPKINFTQPEPVSPQLLEEVVQLNLLDMRLYEYAKNHLSSKKSSYSFRTSSFENILKITSDVDYTFDQPLNGRGWTYRETTPSVYRWVMDSPADIYFPLEEGRDYRLVFNARLLTEEIVPRVKVNEEELEVIKLDNDFFAEYIAIVPKDLILQGPTKVTFYSSKAFQYRDIFPSHYNRNHPPLSFALNRIRISAASLAAENTPVAAFFHH